MHDRLAIRLQFYIDHCVIYPGGRGKENKHQVGRWFIEGTSWRLSRGSRTTCGIENDLWTEEPEAGETSPQTRDEPALDNWRRAVFVVQTI